MKNYIISERQKKLEYDKMWRNNWFWRTTDQKEIDYIEEGDGQIHAFEFKWNLMAKYKMPKQFMENYSGTLFSVITPENMEEFLL